MKSRRQKVKTAASQGAKTQHNVPLESGGFAAWAIRCARNASLKAAPAAGLWADAVSFVDRFSREYERRVLKAGLLSELTRKGYAAARIEMTCLLLGAGALLGAVFSTELSLLLGLVGGGVGWMALLWSLSTESRIRSEKLEGQLGEMVEVIALGLRSGLSFDRAFGMYCEHFDSSFAWACERARQEWSLGLVQRDEALRTLAASYDSALLARLVENIVRSLRFGASFAEMLETTAVEIRSVHKAHVEEKVAKAPVKMLIPVGTLILPAMLIF
ncbi:MAG: type II secretion system F family protein, partial [Raoultibacter sp.]